MHEQPGDEDGLGDTSGAVLGGLERLARGLREAVEVEAVVPVGAADQGQAVGTAVFENVMEGPPEVFEEAADVVGVVVERHRRVEDREIAGLLDVGGDALDQPEGIVVEPGPDIVVAALAQRLVLVVGAAVGKLGGGDVEDALGAPARARGARSRADPGSSRESPCPCRCRSRSTRRCVTC